ncbi:SMI1/KNR4 family protein [Paenibacillus nanensis]|uniref:SMI1/KNR4 family protein n=2 Tax=Paenibacillus nanensis TaxID=393251 RepID=A0A3A1UJL2_9BACL|nr:SMI1/KNR4 family protein [Paenibacillus nanensis]
MKKMQEAVTKEREQHPAFYAKYPMRLITEAEEKDVRNVTSTWDLPEEYVYFLKRYVPERVSWSAVEYISIYIYGAKDLEAGQSGYSYNHVTDEVITDWPSDYLVIASDEGDPYCIDLSRGDTVIFTAQHGTGLWDFSIAYHNLSEFLNSVLHPRELEDEESPETIPSDYYKLQITGTGADKAKTLMFIKKMFSCDYTQAKAYLEKTPLIVYKGIEQGVAKIEEQLERIGADFEKHKISWEEFIELVQS